VPIETTAAVLHGFGERHRIERVQLRDPGRSEVLVRITAAGVCHSDVAQADGDWAFPLPGVLGHEGAGVVEAVGEGVDRVHVGQPVVLSLAPGCGRCRHCALGRPILCRRSLTAMSAGELTTGPSPITGNAGRIAAYSLLACFAGHAVVAASSAIPLPPDVPAELAALVGCAVVTGFGAAAFTLAVEPGSRGAVIGAGGVGVNAIQGARIRGAAEVVAVDPSEERRRHALRFGASATVDPSDPALRQASVDDGFDWTIVTAGVEDPVRHGIDLLRPGGTAAVVGLLAEQRPVPVDMLELVTYERRVVGSAYGSVNPLVAIPAIVRLYQAGRLLLDELVTDRLPLAAIDEAFDRVRRTEGLRPVLLP
jgi:S-(hydroxymethyl)glutathione dehydrogenase/alcohol dehydrogenase